MKSAVRVLVMAALAPSLFAAQPVAEGLREQLKIQRALLERDVLQYEDTQVQLQEAWVRVERESADLLRAQRQGESLDNLRLRDEDLRLAESELMMHLESIQSLRRSILAGEAMIATTEEEIQRIEVQVGAGDDPLTGTWRLAMEPGGQEGRMYLRLDGTLVQGTYQMTGDWSGSLRGTFFARKVRLERIDSQLGFVAVLHGRLQERGEPARLQGSWESTQLASGLPAAGTWVAEKLGELPD